MTDYFPRMSDEYAQKHFPGGAVFTSARETIRRRSIGGIFFFGLFLAGALWGLIWMIRVTVSDISQGENGVYGLVFCAVFALLALGCFYVLRLMLKTRGQSAAQYMADSAKVSKLPINEIEEFDRQSLAGDTYILKLTAGLDRALSNNISSDGLLTRDYIYLADNKQTVMRVDSLLSCCFTEYTYYMTVGGKTKKIHNLAVCLIGPNGVSVLSDTTKEAGLALMALLQERNGAIDTNEGKVLAEGREFDDYRKRIQESR